MKTRWPHYVAIVAPLFVTPSPPSVNRAGISSQSGADTSYVTRGHLVEVRQREYHDRLTRFYRSLADGVRTYAPDLLTKLDPPSQPAVEGYGILPAIVPDGPAKPIPASQVINFSWGWSDTLMRQETAEIDRLEAELARAADSSRASRAAMEKLIGDYRGLVFRRGQIDADVQYNWLWQAAIARDRATFDEMNALQAAALDREAIERVLASGDEAALRAAAASRQIVSNGPIEELKAALASGVRRTDEDVAIRTGWVNPPDFMRVEQPSPHEWVVTVPFYTDIEDAPFVRAFVDAIESAWHVRRGDDEFRMKIPVEVIPAERLYCLPGSPADCAAPMKGSRIDVAAHVARFPPGRQVLTTGAATVRLVPRAFVLGPHAISPSTLAHEFGHVLGMQDAYFRGYRDVGSEGFVVTELRVQGDIMGGSGPVLPRHFEALVKGR